jgi:hypothetical protein
LKLYNDKEIFSGTRPYDEMTINLDDTGAVSGHIPGVSIISGVTHKFYGKPCSRQAVIKVRYKISNIS